MRGRALVFGLILLIFLATSLAYRVEHVSGCEYKIIPEGETNFLIGTNDILFKHIKFTCNNCSIYETYGKKYYITNVSGNITFYYTATEQNYTLYDLPTIEKTVKRYDFTTWPSDFPKEQKVFSGTTSSYCSGSSGTFYYHSFSSNNVYIESAGHFYFYFSSYIKEGWSRKAYVGYKHTDYGSAAYSENSNLVLYSKDSSNYACGPTSQAELDLFLNKGFCYEFKTKEIQKYNDKTYARLYVGANPSKIISLEDNTEYKICFFMNNTVILYENGVATWSSSRDYSFLYMYILSKTDPEGSYTAYVYINIDYISFITFDVDINNVNASYLNISQYYKYLKINSAHDEKTGSTLQFKGTIYSDTGVKSFGTTSSLTEIYCRDNLTGDITLQLSVNDSYAERFYYTNANVTTSMDVYFLQFADGLSYTLYVLDSSGNPIPGALVNVKRFISSKNAYVVVAQGKSNIDGSVGLFLQPQVFYKVDVVANGNTFSFDWVPDPNVRNLQVKLSGSGGTAFTGNVTVEYITPLDGINYYIIPNETFWNSTRTIEYTISSNESVIEYFGMRVTYYNISGSEVLFNQTVTGSPYGGTLQFTIPNRTGHYIVETWFKRYNYSEFVFPKRHYIYWSTSFNSGLSEIMSPGAYLVISIIITAIVTGFFARFVGMGSGIIGLVVFGLLMFINPVVPNWELILTVTGVLVFGALILRGVW